MVGPPGPPSSAVIPPGNGIPPLYAGQDPLWRDDGRGCCNAPTMHILFNGTSTQPDPLFACKRKCQSFGGDCGSIDIGFTENPHLCIVYAKNSTCERWELVRTPGPVCGVDGTPWVYAGDSGVRNFVFQGTEAADAVEKLLKSLGTLPSWYGTRPLKRVGNKGVFRADQVAPTQEDSQQTRRNQGSPQGGSLQKLLDDFRSTVSGALGTSRTSPRRSSQQVLHALGKIHVGNQRIRLGSDNSNDHLSVDGKKYLTPFKKGEGPTGYVEPNAYRLVDLILLDRKRLYCDDPRNVPELKPEFSTGFGGVARGVPHIPPNDVVMPSTAPSTASTTPAGAPAPAATPAGTRKNDTRRDSTQEGTATERSLGPFLMELTLKVPSRTRVDDIVEDDRLKQALGAAVGSAALCNADVTKIDNVRIPSNYLKALLEIQTTQGFVEVPDDDKELVDPTEVLYKRLVSGRDDGAFTAARSVVKGTDAWGREGTGVTLSDKKDSGAVVGEGRPRWGELVVRKREKEEGPSGWSVRHGPGDRERWVVPDGGGSSSGGPEGADSSSSLLEKRKTQKTPSFWPHPTPALARDPTGAGFNPISTVLARARAAVFGTPGEDASGITEKQRVDVKQELWATDDLHEEGDNAEEDERSR